MDGIVCSTQGILAQALYEIKKNFTQSADSLEAISTKINKQKIGKMEEMGVRAGVGIVIGLLE